jgi:Mg2+ and Co2+ transporter CorA
MNVAGMPWLEDASGFWIVCGSMAVLAVVLYFTFKWLKML